MKTTRIGSQECYVLESEGTTVAVTRQGGHMAPVTFFTEGAAPVEPYYVSPWQNEGESIDVPVLKPLRGDFFCLPFGANAAPHTVHGETATEVWSPVGVDCDGPTVTMTLQMDTQVVPGSVVKQVSLVDGQSAVYVRHTVTGDYGCTSFGHHATLGVHNGPLAIRTSPIAFGYTNPYEGGVTADREYYSLASGARFERLDRVPTIWKEPATTDCTVFPAREGFVDILQVVQAPSGGPGWVTATCADGGYLWYSLKDSSILPSTLFWMENHGRHAAPWNGRNACIGLEDVCSFFANGIAASASENFLNAEGVRTCRTLSAAEPFTVSYIEGVVRIPDGFDAVASVRVDDDGVVFTSESAMETTARVNAGFVFGGSV